MDFLEKFEKLNNRLSNLLEENKELNQQCKNFQEENRKLKHVLNLENQKNEQLEIISQNLEEYKRKYESLQEENKNLNEREKHLQQYIQNLEKQKNEQLEIFSQNLEKTLGKLELDKFDKVNENDTNNYDDDSIDYIEDSFAKEAPNKGSTSTPLSTKKELVSSKVKSNRNQHGGGEIRVVVGLDFGTTYSGFSYCHTADSENIITNDQWPGEIGLKTNTVLQYDDQYNTVISWGNSALVKRPSRKMQNRKETQPVELFKLHLSNVSNNLNLHLPNELDYKKAITDYLRKIGEMIKEKIGKSYSGVKYFKQVLLVLTVPAEYSSKAIAIMRDCAFNAELIEDIHSERLQFTTEPEAAAIYCMKNLLREYDLLTTGTTFMIVDCGGGTIDLTIRELIGNNQLGEVTERSGDFCGSTFIDKEFINFLCKKLGDSAINLFKNKCYGQFQYLVQEFCQRVKLPFSGEVVNFPYCLDIDEVAPNLKQYVQDKNKDEMEENEWLIEINYKDIKAMFDPVVERIIKLIDLQLSNARKCSAMFLVGGFSESRYLQKRIKDTFQNRVPNISVPTNPTVAITRGATLYGLSLNDSENNMKINPVIYSRVLKYTYGIKVRNYWMKDKDPIERKIRDGRIDRFHCLARRGTVVSINKEFTKIFTPLSPMQSSVSFRIYYTKEHDAEYCDEPGMELLGKLIIDLSGSGQLDKLLFGFSFGQMEFAVTVKNETSGQYCRTKFEIDG